MNPLFQKVGKQISQLQHRKKMGARAEQRCLDLARRGLAIKEKKELYQESDEKCNLYAFF